MSSNQAGKGDKPRPIKKEEYDRNFDKIVWEKQTTNKPTLKKGKLIYKY